MTQKDIFGNALWLGAKRSEAPIHFLRGRFSVHNASKATLRILGLGFFHCFINGRRVGEDLFLPLYTDFEPRENFPPEEIVSGHRIYVPEYDVLPYLHDGENVITIHFGGGWYTYDQECKFGDSKAIWRLWGEDADGVFEHVSSAEDKIADSFVNDYYQTRCEGHDYTRNTVHAADADYDDSEWTYASEAAAPQTEYHFSDCPADRVSRHLAVRQLLKTDDYTVYDCGENTSGYPVLKLTGDYGEKVTVFFSEELAPDGTLDEGHGYKQEASFICDGTERTVQPLFTWFGFRYFAVSGHAEPIRVEVVHTAVKVTSSFKSDNELLNWIHDTYVNTQLTNMHAGIPSDCPHIERRGYTGDGQLTCHAAMNILDAKAFYRKWIQDIADCQDTISGHVQYTAPYTHSGGGPGGWGCAIVEVPYQYYLHYGDISGLELCYPGMLKYFEYLETHSKSDLVISDKKGEWCLGDWCPPISVILPAPFVNNYFYIKSLTRCIEIARILNHKEDIPLFENRIVRRKEAIMAAYFNSWDGNFLGNQQGANAFALDIGLGDQRTYDNLVEFYKKLKRYDTGIFGTDIVTRILFERGDGQLAADLILSTDPTSFDGMRQAGATTFWEYWPLSRHDRSHNHPMFGAVVAYLYDYLLGIRACEGSAGYEKLVIAPVPVKDINHLTGSRILPSGKVAVTLNKTEGCFEFSIDIPEGQAAEFLWEGNKYPLTPGHNHFAFENSLSIVE